MKTSTILILSAAAIVGLILLLRSGQTRATVGRTTPTYTGGAGYIAATGGLLEGVGRAWRDIFGGDEADDA